MGSLMLATNRSFARCSRKEGLTSKTSQYIGLCPQALPGRVADARAEARANRYHGASETA